MPSCDRTITGTDRDHPDLVRTRLRANLSPPLLRIDTLRGADLPAPKQLRYSPRQDAQDNPQLSAETVPGAHPPRRASLIIATGIQPTQRSATTRVIRSRTTNDHASTVNPLTTSDNARLRIAGDARRRLTEDGAAQALGWPKARVTARVKLLELPERAQQMVGAGAIALSAVDQLRAIGKVSPPLLDALIAYLCRRQRVGRRAADPRAGLGARRRAARERQQGVRRAPRPSIDDYEHRAAEARQEGPRRCSSRRASCTSSSTATPTAPTVRFCDEEVDQARAAGVMIEFERGAPMIVDRVAVPRAGQGGDHAHGRRARGRGRRAAQPSARPAATPERRRAAPIRSPRPSATSAGSCASSPSRRTASTSTSAPACSPACRPWTRRT